MDPKTCAVYVYFKNEQLMEDIFQQTRDKIKFESKIGVTHELEVKRSDEKRQFVRIINYSVRKNNSRIF